MIEIILDTETTGLSPSEDHKIVEIGCIELNNQIPTNKIFHTYVNPERIIDQEAMNIHKIINKALLKLILFLLLGLIFFGKNFLLLRIFLGYPS